MDLTKRKIFLLLLGASGVTLIVLANLFEFGSTHEVFLVAANFHNSSLSYLTSLNLNLGILPDNNKRNRGSLVSKGFRSNLDELVRNPKFNITDVTLRYRKKHTKSLSRDDAAINRSNNGIEIDTVTKVSSSDSIDDWDLSKSRVNNDSPTNYDSDNSVNVGEMTRVTNSAIHNQVSVNFRPDYSYIETRRTNDIKTKPVSANSQSQNALNNDHNSNSNQQLLKQYLSKLTHETEISNRAKNGLEKGFLYRNRSVYGNKPPKEVKQFSVGIENVKDKNDNELINEDVLIPPKDNREINVINNLPKRKESVKDNDKVDEEALKPLSNQNTSESNKIFQTISQRNEVDRTENTQNRQVNTGDIPPEILQKYMKNNEQIANDDDFELLETKASEDNKRDRNFNGNGRYLNGGILQDNNNIQPQNIQEAMGNNVFHQTMDIPDSGQMESHADHGIPDNYRRLESQTDQDKDVLAVEGFSLDTSCSRGFSSFEDILCMKRPQFLPDFRNPCWYQHGILRCLPYFHIIGVCKTGTTDLFERLSHHPQILKNRGILGKETWYWTWRRYGHSNFYRSYAEMMTLNDFIDQFEAPAIESYTKRLPNGTLYHPAVTGHGDPMDFWDQSSWKRIPQNDFTADIPRLTTPSLIKHVNPNIRLILILRDPIERLFSNYLHGQFGSTADEFHRDVVLSRALLKACTANRSMKSCLYDENIIRSLRVPISGSFYSVHIKEWLKVFPRKQIFITRTEAFAKSIANTLLGIFRFLRLDPLPTRDLYRIANMPHFYNTKAKETSGSIRPETIDILRVMFEPYNIELAGILNDENFNFNNVS
ncbi:uncharacterized protein LOC132726294 isoform X2 [Ruditapes philippinarum]|nr:uncharacterized protein LOC132726294 isoform X2 [Ruditapes philippinarum]